MCTRCYRAGPPTARPETRATWLETRDQGPAIRGPCPTGQGGPGCGGAVQVGPRRVLVPDLDAIGAGGAVSRRALARRAWRDRHGRRGDESSHGGGFPRSAARRARGLARRGAGQGRDGASAAARRGPHHRRAVRPAAPAGSSRHTQLRPRRERGAHRVLAHPAEVNRGFEIPAGDGLALGRLERRHARSDAGLHEHDVRRLRGGPRVLRPGRGPVRREHPPLPGPAAPGRISASPTPSSIRSATARRPRRWPPRRRTPRGSCARPTPAR